MIPQSPKPELQQSTAARPLAATGRTASVASERPVTIIGRLLAYQRLWLIGAAVFALDQLTKYWINQHLPLGSYGASGVAVIPGFFNLVHVGNTGAAWSMFSGKSTGLALLAIATLGAIYFWRHQLGLRQPTVQSTFGLLCGGIIGNLLDRVLHGHVIDFIDLHFGNYTYPTFNVADSGICVGVFWYVLWSLRNPTPGESNQ